eukprot:7377574-Alexandrium_andersonii.AAC.1
MTLVRGTAEAQGPMERRLRQDPVLRTPTGDFPLLPYTHVRDAAPPATRTTATVVQLSDALEQA